MHGKEERTKHGSMKIFQGLFTPLIVFSNASLLHSEEFKEHMGIFGELIVAETIT